MKNTIALSTDMRTLYLLDNNRATSFDLENEQGVLIGTIQGEVTVISTKGTGTDFESRLSNAARKEIPLKDSQWTVMYHPDNEVMFIIGAADIDVAIGVDKDVPSKIVTLNLLGSIVNIRRKADMLEVFYMKKDPKDMLV